MQPPRKQLQNKTRKWDTSLNISNKKSTKHKRIWQGSNWEKSVKHIENKQQNDRSPALPEIFRCQGLNMPIKNRDLQSQKHVTQLYIIHKRHSLDTKTQTNWTWEVGKWCNIQRATTRDQRGIYSSQCILWIQELMRKNDIILIKIQNSKKIEQS